MVNADMHLAIVRSTTGYGFLSRHSDFLRSVMNTENEVNVLEFNAEYIPHDERLSCLRMSEDKKFDSEHYMYASMWMMSSLIPNRADFSDDEEVQDIIAWKNVTLVPPATFTEGEKVAMLRLPRRECASQSYCDYRSSHRLRPFR